MSANAAKSLANARSPGRGGNRLLWKNDTAANSTEHPGAEAGFWGGTGTAAGSIAERPDAHQHGAARACHSHPVALDAVVKVAAAPVLLEVVEGLQQHHFPFGPRSQATTHEAGAPPSTRSCPTQP